MRNINKPTEVAKNNLSIDKSIEETRNYIERQGINNEEKKIEINSIQIFVGIPNKLVYQFEEKEIPLSVELCKAVEGQINLPENQYTFEDCEFDGDDDCFAQYILTYSKL